MKIEDNRKDEDKKYLKDIKAGECFEDVLGEIVIRTDQVFGSEMIGLNIRNGKLVSYNKGAAVKLVNAKVVIE